MMRDLLIIILSLCILWNACDIYKLQREIKELKQNKVTLICDNYVYKENLNQALAKNCYVVKGGER